VVRSGRSVIVEVYPAASLKLWGMSHRGYKRPQTLADLNRLVDELQAAAPWLDSEANESACRRHRDATDAVIAALTARAAFHGLTTRARWSYGSHPPSGPSHTQEVLHHMSAAIPDVKETA
jgi:hypothetical protein